MSCVHTVEYTIVLNGVQGKTFKPSRRLRQCTSLSPYLFLFCSEGFSSLLQATKAKGTIKGVKMWRSNLAITYLFFCR